MAVGPLNTLVVNSGSSSLKLALLSERDEVLARESLPAVGDLSSTALGEALDRLLEGRSADAVGHRIVHGGIRYTAPVPVTADVLAELDALTDLAPLHQPKSLAAYRAVTDLAPSIPAIACFDTAFFAALPAAAASYAVPRAWRERWGVRRYGFHGLSHAHIARTVTDRVGSSYRLVSCHIGAGASLAGIVDGTPVDTTMGFTPLEGLVMATRSGSVDPGLVLWLEEHEGLRPREVATALERESGLKGLAGTGDLREVLARRAGGDPDAALAFDVYVHSIVRHIGAMAASCGGVDLLVFTGGVGENSEQLREAVQDRIAFMHLDDILVIPAREDLEIAREVRQTLAG